MEKIIQTLFIFCMILLPLFACAPPNTLNLYGPPDSSNNLKPGVLYVTTTPSSAKCRAYLKESEPEDTWLEFSTPAYLDPVAYDAAGVLTVQCEKQGYQPQKAILLPQLASTQTQMISYSHNTPIIVEGMPIYTFGKTLHMDLNKQ